VTKKLVNIACRGLRLTLPGYSPKKVLKRGSFSIIRRRYGVISTVSKNIRQIHRRHGKGFPRDIEAIGLDLQDGIVPDLKDAPYFSKKITSPTF